MIAFNSIFPVFALIFFGWFLRRKKRLSEATAAQLTNMLYWWAVPALLFIKFANIKSLSVDIGNYFYAFMVATLSAVFLGYVVAVILRLPKVQTGALVHISYRGNLAFVGLPIALYYISQLQTPELEAVILLALSPMIIVYNVLAVCLLVLHGGSGKGQVKLGIYKTITNPLILSCIIGLFFRLQEWSLPFAINETLVSLSSMVVPLSLIVVGASVEFKGGGKDNSASFLGALIKTGFTPWAAYFASNYFGVDPNARTLLMFFLAAPTAASAYILAKQLGSDATMTANATLMGTFTALVSLLLIFASL
ncbi:MAG: AEC family transporter [SAR324 cluster bacterium]|nr:AEC family transporter [SAR324 cluster bacterium]